MSDEQSLSIEETNRLRLSLGLKPLTSEPKTESTPEENYAAYKQTLNKTQQEEQLRQKIEK
jgi:U4/U6.U5 tri-snRNP-associated protein 1